MSNFFPPKSSFFSLWPTIILTVVIAALTGGAFWIICSSGNLEFSWTAGGLAFALKTFQIPLGIIGSSLPLYALLAVNHRSEQSKEQIQQAVAQNNFSNHFKHIEEFIKYVADSDEHKGQFKHPRLIHSRIYPNAPSGDFTQSEKIKNALLIYVTDNWHELIDNSESLASPKSVEKHNRAIVKLAKAMGLEYKNLLFNVTSGVHKGTLEDFSVNLVTQTVFALSFSTDYIPPDAVADYTFGYEV